MEINFGKYYMKINNGLWRNWSDAPDLGSDAENDACEFESHQIHHFFNYAPIDKRSKSSALQAGVRGSNPLGSTNKL